MESYPVHSGPSSEVLVPGNWVMFQVDDNNEGPWRGAVPCQIEKVSPTGEIRGITTENGRRQVVAFPYDPITRRGKIVIH